MSIAILGGGKMGEALLSGLLRSGTPPADLVVSEKHEERARHLAGEYGVDAVSVAEAAKRAETLIIAVKPQDMQSLLDELSPALPDDRLVVSVAAGIPTAFIEARLPSGAAVVRVMSNTPVLVDEAMSAVSGGSHATEVHLGRTEELLGHVGKVLRVPESQLDAVTALSGSGPAYFFYLVEAMVDAGILLGLPRAVAHDLIVQTAVGAAVMLRDTKEHPVALREAVTSPAGTTIAAIKELERHGVRAAFLAALEAARDRSQELARGQG
jgi:pyrroline-5-carboxylate reductase